MADLILTNRQLMKQFEKEGKNFYSRNSMTNYGVDIWHFIEYLEEKSVLIQTTSDLAIYLKTLSEKTEDDGTPTYKQSTLNRNRASLVAFYNFIKSKGLMDHNPAIDLKSITIYRRGEEGDIEFLTKEEMKQLLQEIKDDKYTNHFNQSRDLVLYHFMLTTGVRINEVATLTFDQLDFDTHQATIVDKDGFTRVVNFPKTIDAEMEVYLAERQRLGIESDLVFVTKRGTPISFQNSNAALKKYGDAIGLNRKISNVALRHTYAINLLELGRDVEFVSERLGHKSAYYTSLLYQDFLGLASETYAEQIDV